MALGTISITQTPTNTSSKFPVIVDGNPIIPYSVKQTDISGLFYFKFVLEIRIDDASGTLLAKIKQRKNGSTTGTSNVTAIFDVKEIVKTQLSRTIKDPNDTDTDDTSAVWTLGVTPTTDIFALNNNQILKIYVKAYQEFSSAANTMPTEDTSTTANATFYYINGRSDYNIPRTSTFFQITVMPQYQMSANTKYMLSDLRLSPILSKYSNYGTNGTDDLGNCLVNYVNSNDYHCIAFLNGNNGSGLDFDSDAYKIRVAYYNETTAGTTADITNATGQGGAVPSGTTTSDQGLLHFGCGPANLEAQTIDSNLKPSNNTYTHYSIHVINNSDAQMSRMYWFIKDDCNPKDYKIRRLAWLNSMGCWDFYNFKMKSTQTLDIQRNNFSKLRGEYNDATYSYTNYSRGAESLKVDAKIKETISTDYIPEQYVPFIESLLVSKEVYIIADSTSTLLENTDKAVMITDSSFIRKTSANDGLIEYTINLEHANDTISTHIN